MIPILIWFVVAAILNVVILVSHVKRRYQMGPYTFKFFTVMYFTTLAMTLIGLILLIVFAVEEF